MSKKAQTSTGSTSSWERMDFTPEQEIEIVVLRMWGQNVPFDHITLFLCAKYETTWDPRATMQTFVKYRNEGITVGASDDNPFNYWVILPSQTTDYREKMKIMAKIEKILNEFADVMSQRYPDPSKIADYDLDVEREADLPPEVFDYVNLRWSDKCRFKWDVSDQLLAQGTGFSEFNDSGSHHPKAGNTAEDNLRRAFEQAAKKEASMLHMPDA
ncbi:MAG: hypothetical protein Q9166_005300 [cf. Caloplaca sp. 2 TL-2023]